jgi:3-hydroxybutyryl-CoA dehydrogenase
MKVMVIGSGTMGTGISQLLMSCHAVSSIYIYSRSTENLKNLFDTCVVNLTKLVRKGKLDESLLAGLESRVHLVTELKFAQQVDLVIEAISECYEAKFALLQDLVSHLGEHTVFATNTSSLSITALGARLPHPANALGLHFFNPAPLMELVEVVQGFVTSPEVVSKMTTFATSLGKSPVVVNEGPGFVVNRMLIPMINEAICILADDVASKEDIDKSMMLGAHHPMGPLKLSDLIGNDVVLSIMDTLYQETGDTKYRANPLLRKMVRANYLGRKTKQGFYSY